MTISSGYTLSPRATLVSNSHCDVKSDAKQIQKRIEEHISVANYHSWLLQNTSKKFVRPLFMWWNIVPIDTGINKSGTLHCRQWHSRPLLLGLLAGRWRHYMAQFFKRRARGTQVDTGVLTAEYARVYKILKMAFTKIMTTFYHTEKICTKTGLILKFFDLLI